MEEQTQEQEYINDIVIEETITSFARNYRGEPNYLRPDTDKRVDMFLIEIYGECNIEPRLYWWKKYEEMNKPPE